MDRVISGACDSIHVWIGVVENGLGKKRTSTEKEGGGRGRARLRCERCDAATTTTTYQCALQLPFIYPKL
jgi:hypothetical protein